MTLPSLTALDHCRPRAFVLKTRNHSLHREISSTPFFWQHKRVWKSRFNWSFETSSIHQQWIRYKILTTVTFKNENTTTISKENHKCAPNLSSCIKCSNDEQAIWLVENCWASDKWPQDGSSWNLQTISVWEIYSIEEFVDPEDFD